jgi:hypothetical protein
MIAAHDTSQKRGKEQWLLHVFSLPLPVQTIIITLKPCALNAEFQHFMFNK